MRLCFIEIKEHFNFDQHFIYFLLCPLLFGSCINNCNCVAASSNVTTGIRKRMKIFCGGSNKTGNAHGFKNQRKGPLMFCFPKLLVRDSGCCEIFNEGCPFYFIGVLLKEFFFEKFLDLVLLYTPFTYLISLCCVPL